MIPWKTYWTVGGAVATASGTALMVLLALPVYITIGVLVLAAAAFTLTAARVVHGHAMFQQVRSTSRTSIVRLIAVGAAVYAVIGAMWAIRPSLWGLCLGMYAGAAGVAWLVAHGHEYMLTQLTPRAPRTGEQAAPQAPEVAGALVRQDDPPVLLLKSALNRAGYGYLNILDWEPISNGNRPVGVRYKTRVPSRKAVADKTGKDKGDTTSLDGKDAEPMAIAMSEVLGHDLESDFVTIAKQPGAGTYSITVLTEDVMATVYEYVDDPTPTSITQPVVLGYEVDGTPYAQNICGHGSDVGQTGSGKSSRVNVKTAFILRCTDAAMWMCGVEKVYETLAPWLDPYRGTSYRSPFDWVASGAYHTVAMLAAAMKLARYRQGPHPAYVKRSFKKLIVQLDEASFALVIKHITAIYGGENCNASRLADMLMRGARSGNVFLHLVSQQGTNGNWGDYGSSINANMMWQTVFYTRDEGEIGRATGDYKLPRPRHTGVYWMQESNTPSPKQLKAPFIQEDDPGKAKVHDGATVSEVSWARRTIDHRLDEDSTKFLQRTVAEYADRHTMVTDDMLAYLAGFGADDMPQHGGDYDDAKADVADVLAGLRAAADWATTGSADPGGAEPVVPQQVTPAAAAAPAPAAAPSAPTVAVLTQHKPRKTRIHEIVRDSQAGPMQRGDIIEALRAQGDHAVSDQVVTNTLKQLLNDGALTRDGGTYAAV